MKLILITLRELYGLFVDDSSYALIIFLWLIIAGVVLPHIIASGYCAPIMCLGLLLILIENIRRSIRA